MPTADRTQTMEKGSGREKKVTTIAGFVIEAPDPEVVPRYPQTDHRPIRCSLLD